MLRCLTDVLFMARMSVQASKLGTNIALCAELTLFGHGQSFRIVYSSRDVVKYNAAGRFRGFQWKRCNGTSLTKTLRRPLAHYLL